MKWRDLEDQILRVRWMTDIARSLDMDLTADMAWDDPARVRSAHATRAAAEAAETLETMFYQVGTN